MAIIRNDRARQREPEVAQEVEAEEEIDYDWHPTEDEYVSPLTAEQWAELFSDARFCESDAAQAVRCLRAYGEPATFQQLSIRYRGTMGRYRRWLGEAAQAAGERFGVAAPQQNQFGMDEWWPLLYQTRNTGKPGAGIFEMALRPEVEDAFLLIEEQERQARRAENARNLQRIEQLERARQEERERRAAEVAAAVPAQAPEPEPEPESVQEAVEPQQEAEATPAPAAAPQPEPEVTDVFIPVLSALQEYLKAIAPEQRAGASRYIAASQDSVDVPLDVAAPLDYALRYAERLRYVLALMRDAIPGISAATVARELEDESVAQLQEVLNGQRIPTFAYLDGLRECLCVNVERLEASDGWADNLPAFCTLQELYSPEEVADLLVSDPPTEIAYVVDDAPERHTGLIVRFAGLRCALLTRTAAEAQEDEFLRMVDELDDFARVRGVARSSRSVSAAQWDALVAGTLWPGKLL